MGGRKRKGEFQSFSGPGYKLTGPQDGDYKHSASCDNSPAEKPAKKPKKAKETSGQDKRLAKWKPKAPQAIMDRADRAMSQRMFMISRSGRQDGVAPSETFQILGSTGNVYSVTITHQPSCTCPDAQKGNHCKQVLGLPASSPHWYQKALLTSELEEIFATARPAPGSIDRSEEFKRLQSGQGSSKDVELDTSTLDDICAICYEDMKDAKPSELWQDAAGCHKFLHKECLAQWQRSRVSKQLTCPWCNWPDYYGRRHWQGSARY